MSGSTFGNTFRITTWGESHGAAIGAVIDGCPAGLPLEASDIQAFLDRRKPGQSRFTTKRQEGDQVEILSGTFEGQTTGTPISLLCATRTSVPGTMEILLPYTVRDTPTTLIRKNTASGITGAEGVPPGGKPSDGWPVARWLPKF